MLPKIDMRMTGKEFACPFRDTTVRCKYFYDIMPLYTDNYICICQSERTYHEKKSTVIGGKQ